MINAQIIKQKALEYGAAAVGIGDIELFNGVIAQRDPKMILPHAKCIIGFLFRVPRALYRTMDNGNQFMQYTSVGVKYIDEDLSEIFLLKMGGLIENEGYDACLQRTIPGFRIQGDKSMNPEVRQVYELQFASAVSPDKPVPDVVLDFNRAAVVCGLGAPGMNGKVLVPKYGPYMRFFYIITDMPLDVDAPFEGTLCDGCGKCMQACPSKAISEKGVDSWQCSVYYRGAHQSNPFAGEDALKDHPEREQILKGEKRFDKKSAEEIYGQLKYLPATHFGYMPCLCGKACETVCYRHLKEVGKL